MSISDSDQQVSIAEDLLDKMMMADATKDYEGFLCSFDPEDSVLGDFTREKLEDDVDEMQDDPGASLRREFLGCIKGGNKRRQGCLRFICKGISEKNETVIIVGIHQRDGIWYANEGMWH